MNHVAPAQTSPPAWRYRAAVALRTVAAAAGGYALSAACAAAGALSFARMGMARADAALAATMLAFAVHAVAAMWAFGCASVWRAWFGIGLPAAVLGVAAWALAPGAQP